MAVLTLTALVSYNRCMELVPFKVRPLKTIVAEATAMQSVFLTLKAMGCDDMEARRLSGVATVTFERWKRDELFLQLLSEIFMTDHKAEAIDVFLDINLPAVLGELLRICLSGSDGDRPHKDKERAIEFYLKELCGVSKHVEKSMSVAKILMQLQEGGAIDAAD